MSSQLIWPPNCRMKSIKTDRFVNFLFNYILIVMKEWRSGREREGKRKKKRKHGECTWARAREGKDKKVDKYLHGQVKLSPPLPKGSAANIHKPALPTCTTSLGWDKIPTNPLTRTTQTSNWYTSFTGTKGEESEAVTESGSRWLIYSRRWSSKL